MNNELSPGQSKVSGRFIREQQGKGVLMTVLFLLMSTFLFAQSPEARQGLRLIDIEQPSKGIAALEQAAQNNGGNLYYLGLGYIRTGSLDKALATFEKGISANEKDGMSLAGKGHVKMLQKNPTEAKTYFDKALAVTKNKNAEVIRAVGAGYLADSKFLLDALNLLNKAKGMNNGDPETHMLLGDAYLMQNNGGESVSSYERASRADAKLAKAPYKVALVYQRSKNNELVVENLNKAISIDPEFAPAYKELGEVSYLKKDAANAVKAYEKYLSLTEKPGDAKYQLAFFYFMAKDFEKANTIFKEVLANPNASPTALKYYGRSLVEQEKNDEARQVFEQYFQKEKPENIQAADYAYYGKLLTQLNQDSLANEQFTKSLELDSAQAEVLQLHAASFTKRKKYAEAAETIQKLMGMRKQPLAQDYWLLGQSYYFNDQPVEADSAISKVIEIQGEKTPLPVYLYAARSKSRIDSTLSVGTAKPMYDTLLEKSLKDPDKNKKYIIEAYEYLGNYYLHVKNDVLQSKGYFQKILQLDPTHENAKNFMKELNKPAPQQKGGR